MGEIYLMCNRGELQYNECISEIRKRRRRRRRRRTNKKLLLLPYSEAKLFHCSRTSCTLFDTSTFSNLSKNQPCNLPVLHPLPYSVHLLLYKNAFGSSVNFPSHWHILFYKHSLYSRAVFCSCQQKGTVY